MKINDLKLIIKEEVKKIISESGDPARDEILQTVLDWDAKYRKSKQPWIKRSLKQARAALEKYDRNIDRKNFNIADIKKIIQSHGLNRTTYRTTSIRGFSYPSPNSYEISKSDASLISFYGINTDKFDAIVNDIKTAGFKISDESAPSKIPGGPSAASIKLEK